jgi:hypothetical protein
MAGRCSTSRVATLPGRPVLLAALGDHVFAATEDGTLPVVVMPPA